MWVAALAVTAVAGACHREPAKDAAPTASAGQAAEDHVVVPGTHGLPAFPAGAKAAKAAEDRAAPRAAPDMGLTPEEGELAIDVPPATAGVEATAHLRLTAHHGYEINEKFHHRVTFTPTPGIALPAEVTTEHLDGHELALAMKLTAAKPGDYTVHGTFAFAVCQGERQCRPKSTPITLQIAAK